MTIRYYRSRSNDSVVGVVNDDGSYFAAALRSVHSPISLQELSTLGPEITRKEAIDKVGDDHIQSAEHQVARIPDQ